MKSETSLILPLFPFPSSSTLWSVHRPLPWALYARQGCNGCGRNWLGRYYRSRNMRRKAPSSVAMWTGLHHLISCKQMIVNIGLVSVRVRRIWNQFGQLFEVECRREAFAIQPEWPWSAETGYTAWVMGVISGGGFRLSLTFDLRSLVLYLT